MLIQTNKKANAAQNITTLQKIAAQSNEGETPPSIIFRDFPHE